MDARKEKINKGKASNGLSLDEQRNKMVYQGAKAKVAKINKVKASNSPPRSVYRITTDAEA